MSTPPEATRNHNSIKLLIPLPLRADLLLSVHSETPCTGPSLTLPPMRYGFVRHKDTKASLSVEQESNVGIPVLVPCLQIPNSQLLIHIP